MTTTRRWLRSVLAASQASQPALPWTRGQRRKPATLCAAKPALPVPERRRAG